MVIWMEDHASYHSYHADGLGNPGKVGMEMLQSANLRIIERQTLLGDLSWSRTNHVLRDKCPGNATKTAWWYHCSECTPTNCSKLSHWTRLPCVRTRHPLRSLQGGIKVECVCVSVYSNCNKSYNTMTSMYLCTSMTISRLPWKSSKLICGNMSDEEVTKFWVRRCSYWIEYHHMQKVMKQLRGEQPFHSLSNAHRIFVIFKKI